MSYIDNKSEMTSMEPQKVFMWHIATFKICAHLGMTAIPHQYR